jgi:hypothetical protein
MASDLPPRVREAAEHFLAGNQPAQIAARMGISLYTAQHYLADARAAGALPPLKQARKYARLAAALAEDTGERDVERAARLGISVQSLRHARARAIRNGMLPPPARRPPPAPREKRPRGKPINHYHALRAKGAAPPLGSLGAIVEALSWSDLSRLLAAVAPSDTTLADTVRRLALERLNAPDAR